MYKELKDLKVGDTVWYTDVNGGRHGRPYITEGKITKIGSKLITVGHIVFRKDTMKTNDNYMHQSLVIDKQKYDDDCETSRLHTKLRDNFSIYSQRRFPLSKLKDVCDILGIDYKEKT